MRRIILLVALAVGLTAAPLGLSADQSRIASHCSASGDVCYGIFQGTKGLITFKLTTAAKFFRRYRICVRPLGTTATCKRFPVRKTGASCGGTGRLQKNFPQRCPRRERVTWPG